MPAKSVTKYSLIMRINHWAIAAIIFFQLGLGWYMTPYQEGKPEWDTYYYLHKSFGVLFFMWLIVRVISRWRSPAVPLPDGFSTRDKLLAKWGHVGLYLLMFLVPVAGYLMSSAYEYSDGVYFFSLFNVPEVLEKSEAGFNFFSEVHEISAYTLLVLVVLHVAAAFKHKFFDGKEENNVFPRMM